MEVRIKTNQAETKWQEVTEEMYWEMLEVLPPSAWKGGAFAVGEPMTHDQLGPVHETFVKLGERYFARDAHLMKFDPKRYESEIKEQFSL